MNKIHQDSTGNVIELGDCVKFRGVIYTIADFYGSRGACDTAQIRFVEPQDTPEIADEISVDKV